MSLFCCIAHLNKFLIRVIILVPLVALRITTAMNIAAIATAVTAIHLINRLSFFVVFSVVFSVWSIDIRLFSSSIVALS
jgi:hypothetical protein